MPQPLPRLRETAGTGTSRNDIHRIRMPPPRAQRRAKHMAGACIENFQEIPQFADIRLDRCCRPEQDVTSPEGNLAHEREEIVCLALTGALVLCASPVRFIEDHSAVGSFARA